MNEIKSIPAEVIAIIPHIQLVTMKENISHFTEEIEYLKNQLLICPKLYETEKLNEHPVIFHYGNFSSDIFVCEYSPEKKLMFGYTVLNDDIDNAEWGYISLDEILQCPIFIDISKKYTMSIEAILYKVYPDRFKKPKSLEQKK